ncbi:MAG: thiamine phosphate synthase [bacterium]
MADKSKRSIYRALDANLNRAVEGVRVAEDVVRFGHDDGALAARFRKVRHGLRAAAGMLPGGAEALVAARDSRGDVARNAPPVAASQKRDVLAVNLKRAQEAARVLEEISKQFSTAAAAQFGEMRFNLYDLERDAARYFGSIGGPRRMPKTPFLYAVASYEDFYSGGSFKTLKALLSAGAGMIQLRDKNVEDKERLARALRVGRYFKNKNSLFVVNDRVDLALAAGSDVVHLGQDDLPVAEGRKIAGDKLLIGFSSHSYAQAMKGLEQKPDYLAVGPIFSSPTKPGGKPVTPKLIERVAAKAGDIPIVAIGGITVGNTEQVFDAGASGAAMISALTGSRDLEKTLASINEIIERKRR